MPKTQVKIHEFRSLEDFRKWWSSPEIVQFLQKHPDKLTRLREHRWVKPWLPYLEEPGNVSSLSLPQLVGKTFGKYQVEKQIGAGGMAAVYLASDPGLNRKVALKIMSLRGQEAIERFTREARAAAKLKHPHIIQIYEIGAVDQYHYFTMEYVEGESLDNLIQNKEKHLSHRQVAEIICDIASALHYAHRQQIIHRDIKPANILLDKENKAYLTDFGLAKELVGLERSLTLSGTIMGTPEYMSPEQARGDKRQINQRSDIFSLGATLYYGLTGQPPFRGKELYQILESVVKKDPIPPRRFVPRIPQELETICLKCLEKEMERRYQNAEELAQDLHRYLSGVAIHARPAGFVSKIWRKASQNRIASLALIGAAVLLIAVIIGLVISSSHTKRRIAEYRQAAYQKIQDKQFAEAVAICNKILALAPQDHEIQSALKECEQALKEQEEALRRAKEKAETEAAQARLARERREKAKAILDRIGHVTKPQDKIDIAHEALKIDPGFGDAYQIIGYAYNGLKDYDKAFEYFSKAIETTPSLAYSYFERALITAFVRNKPKDVLPDFNKVLELDPNSHIGYFAKGTINDLQHNYDQAIENYNKVIELKPDYAWAYYNRGTAYLCKGDLDRAIADYNKATELNPDYVKAYHNRGNAYVNKGDLNRAIADYTKAIELKPDFVEAYANRGNTYDKKGEWDRAIADYNKAIELQPDDAQNYFDRGITYDKKGEMAQAIRDYDKAIELKPDYSYAYFNRGGIYVRKNELDRAIADFTKVIELKPDYAVAYYNRGIIYYHQGEIGRAIADLETFVRLDPNNPDADQTRKEIEALKKRLQK